MEDFESIKLDYKMECRVNPKQELKKKQKI